MKALFVHDHIFKYIPSEKLLFSEGKLNNNSFNRYLNHFNELTIISRSQAIESKHNVANLNEINDDRINFIPFDNQSTFKNRFIKRKKYRHIIRNIIKNYDAIIIRVPSEIGFLVSEVCSEENKPYICEVVACPIDAMKALNNIKSNLYLPIIKKTMCLCVKNSYASLYVTETFLQERYPTNSLSVSASNVELDKTSSTSKKLLDKKSYTIAHIGNLDSEHKGYPVIYQALSYLDDKIRYKINVLLIGAGIKYRKKQIYKNINIIYTGNLKKEKIHDLLENEVDLYIQPSTQEGLPRATIEAMSHALPCIVSSAGGLPELIESTYVHKPSDFKSLSIMIDNLLKKPNEYNKQSLKNLKKSSKYLSSVLTPIRFDFYSNYVEYLNLKREKK